MLTKIQTNQAYEMITADRKQRMAGSPHTKMNYKQSYQCYRNEHELFLDFSTLLMSDNFSSSYFDSYTHTRKYV